MEKVEKIGKIFFSARHGKQFPPSVREKNMELTGMDRLVMVLFFLSGQMLVQHDLQDSLIGLDHPIVAEGPHVLDGFLG